MTLEESRRIVIESLSRVAPEIDPSSIQPAVSLRDQLDLDSMDFLNFVRTLHERLGVEIPESDYARCSTLESAVAYVVSRGVKRP